MTYAGYDAEQLPSCWQDFYAVLEAGIDRVILYGPPGTGKSYAGLNYGEIDQGAWRLECTEGMTEFDIVGGFMPNGQGTWDYHEGKAIMAWTGDGVRGGRLVIDEIDKATGDIYALLLAMTDNPESAFWMHPQSKRTVRPHDGFSVIMTTNVENMEELPEALVDRFPTTIRINEPHPAALERLPREYREYASRMADAGDRRISLRTFYALATLSKSIGEAEAARIILGNRAEGFLDAIAVNRV